MLVQIVGPRQRPAYVNTEQIRSMDSDPSGNWAIQFVSGKDWAVHKSEIDKIIAAMQSREP